MLRRRVARGPFAGRLVWAAPSSARGGGEMRPLDEEEARLTQLLFRARGGCACPRPLFVQARAERPVQPPPPAFPDPLQIKVVLEKLYKFLGKNVRCSLRVVFRKRVAPRGHWAGRPPTRSPPPSSLLVFLLAFANAQVRAVVERPDAPHCFRLHRQRVFYVREDIMRRATNVRPRGRQMGLRKWEGGLKGRGGEGISRAHCRKPLPFFDAL